MVLFIVLKVKYILLKPDYASALKIYPMMGLRPLTENDEVKKIQRNVDLSFTPNR